MVAEKNGVFLLSFAPAIRAFAPICADEALPQDSSLQQHLTTAPLPSQPPPSLHRSQCLTGMLRPCHDAIGWPLMLMRCNCSIRAASRAAGVRPALNLSRPAFQPIKKNFAPAVCTRLASTSTSAKDGRIHTVIGAVVDGTLRKILFLFPRLLTSPTQACDKKKLCQSCWSFERDANGWKQSSSTLMSCPQFSMPWRRKTTARSLSWKSR